MNPAPANSAARTIRRIFASVTVAWFLAGICLPSVDDLFHIDPALPVQEMRAYATFPDRALLKQGRYREWTTRFESWYNDHFGFRDSLLRMNSYLRVILLRSPPRSDVVVGEGDWFYLGGLPQMNTRGLDPFSRLELERWRFGLEGWREFCAAHGAKILLALVPDKQEIYPEHLPARERLIGPASRTEQLVSYLEETGSDAIDLLDLRGTLRDERKQGEVFLHTDTHWNPRGAAAGYRAIVARLQQWFPALESRAPAVLDFSQFPDALGDLTKMVCVEYLSHEANGMIDAVKPVAKRYKFPVPPELGIKTVKVGTFSAETPRHDLPKILIFRDSFTTVLERVLQETFSRSVFINVSHTNAQVPFEPSLVERERPDVVLVLSVDRYLVGLLPEQIARIGGKFDLAALDAHYRVAEDLTGAGLQRIELQNQVTSLGGHPSLVLHAPNSDPQLLVPCAPVPVGKRIRVDVTMASPVESRLELFRTLPGTTGYTPSATYGVTTRAGWNRVRIYLPPTGSAGPIRLDPGTFAGDYAIFRIEIAVEE